MWNGTQRLMCLNCPQIVVALFAGGGCGTFETLAYLEEGPCNGLWCLHLVVACKGHVANSCVKDRPTPSSTASLVWWTNFPETVSQDKHLLSQTTQFSIVRYWPQWQVVVNTLVFTHNLFNLTHFLASRWWYHCLLSLCPWHYVLPK